VELRGSKGNIEVMREVEMLCRDDFNLSSNGVRFEVASKAETRVDCFEVACRSKKVNRQVQSVEQS